MKITKSQLKQIIKEELARSLEEEEYKGDDENLLTDLETITKHLQDIEEITQPDSMESGEQVDLYGGDSESEVERRIEALNEIHRMAADAYSMISKIKDHIGDMVAKDSPTPAFDLGDDEELRLGDVDQDRRLI